MIFLDLLRSRRSIRRFQQRPVEPALVAQLVESALRAPSSRGRNPWEFILVDDADMLDALSRAKPHGSSVWVEDASIATIFVQLAAHSMGLGSCWVQIRKRFHADGVSAEAYISDHLGIPSNRRVATVIAIGHPEKSPPGHDTGSLEHHKVHRGRYGASSS